MKSLTTVSLKELVLFQVHTLHIIAADAQLCSIYTLIPLTTLSHVEEFSVLQSNNIYKLKIIRSMSQLFYNYLTKN